jgi:hypothetical protein
MFSTVKKYFKKRLDKIENRIYNMNMRTFTLTKFKGTAYKTNDSARAYELFENDQNFMGLYSSDDHGNVTPLITRTHKDKLLSNAGSMAHLEKYCV